MKYIVRYEFEAWPSSVIIEIVCNSLKEAEICKEERLHQKKVEIIEK